MRVLVSCKTTNLDVHGEAIRKKIDFGRLDEAHLRRLQEDHDNHQRSLETLFTTLDRIGFERIEVGRGQYWPDLATVDVVVTVGGDGTVLEASHHIGAHPVPVIGVRSSAMSIGRLCATDEAGLTESLERFAAGKHDLSKVARLRARIAFTRSGGEIETDPILNDFLYANSFPAATTRYKLCVAGHEEVQKSSGIWIATAAGSTAAIATAGGRPLDLEERCFQYAVRELYSYGSANAPQLRGSDFTPDRDQLCIENRCEQAILALDGQHGHIALDFGDTIRLEEAPPLLLVRPVPVVA